METSKCIFIYWIICSKTNGDEKVVNKLIWLQNIVVSFLFWNVVICHFFAEGYLIYHNSVLVLSLFTRATQDITFACNGRNMYQVCQW